jgi:hypothetical protein
MKKVFSLFAALMFLGLATQAQIATRSERFDNFSGLSIGSAFEVVLVQGSNTGVVLEVDERYMDQVFVDVKGGVLEVSTKGTIRNPKKMKATITFRELEKMDFSGATKVRSEADLNFGALSIDASGATKMTLNLQASSLKISTSGASNMEFTGSTGSLEVDLSGASKLDAADLKVQDGSISTSGASKADVWFTGKLDVEASGASKITYKGNPSLGKVKTSGASSLKSVG